MAGFYKVAKASEYLVVTGWGIKEIKLACHDPICFFFHQLQAKEYPKKYPVLKLYNLQGNKAFFPFDPFM